MKNEKFNSSARVALIYFIFSSFWIFLSDYVLLLFLDDISSYRYISTIKGTAFVIISAIIIYFLVHREVVRLKKVKINVDTLEHFDILTGIHNRSSFSNEIDRIATKKIDASVILADINGLKLVNELHSSQDGDNILIHFATNLKNNTPKDAFVARIGGDEYCVILYDCDNLQVTKTVADISKAINQNNSTIKEYSFALGYSSTCEADKNIYSALSLAEDRMLKNKLLINESASNSIITTLKTTLFERSDETEQHASRMESYCKEMGMRLDLPHSEVNELELLAILHDIGKIGIDDNILKKPGKLNELEYNMMKQHSTIGFKMASSVSQLAGISYYILTHHEKWDGTGYPKGLKETEIPLASRILAIVDAFDAMTNDRVYRKAMEQESAIQELIDNKGTQFEPALVDIFIDVLKNQSVMD